MAQRGRKSAAALAIVTPVVFDGRPPPPDGLTGEQREEWAAVVRRMPADWFTREAHALLEGYVRHVASFRLLSASIDAFLPEWLTSDDGLKRYGDLLKLRDAEGRAMSSLATRLRITPQSRYHPTTAARAAADAGSGRTKPWMKHA